MPVAGIANDGEMRFPLPRAYARRRHFDAMIRFR